MDSGDKNERKRLLRRNGKSMSSAESGDVMPGCKLEKEGVRWQEEYTTMSVGPPEPVLTLLPTPWDGASMNGPGKGHMRVPNGLGTYGAPAPWTINS